MFILWNKQADIKFCFTVAIQFEDAVRGFQLACRVFRSRSTREPGGLSGALDNYFLPLLIIHSGGLEVARQHRQALGHRTK